jgi:hypothetical protein
LVDWFQLHGFSLSILLLVSRLLLFVGSFLVLGRLTADEFEEPAFLAIAGLFLIQEGEILFVELLEELIPLDFLERVLAAIARKIDTQHARLFLVAGSLHRCRLAAAFFHPFPDNVVVSRGFAFSSHSTHILSSFQAREQTAYQQ